MAFQKNVHSVSVEIGGREITFETGWVEAASDESSSSRTTRPSS